MENKSSNIPIKVIISYIALAALVIGVGWVLYTENAVYSKIETKIEFEKSKIIKISKLFSNVYKTESLARKTIQSNSEVDFQNYINETDSLQTRIDSLKKGISSDYQVRLLDSITILLSEKIKNIRQLKAIKNKKTDEISVNEAIQELTQLEFSLRKLQLRDFAKDPNQLGSYQRNVLQRYVDYLNQNIPDDSTNTLTKKATDSILSASKRLLSKVKKETEKKKESLSLQENKLLTNEILISDQLRKVLRIIEREIITYSIKNNTEKEKSLKKLNQIVTYAAIAGLFLTIFFSILIMSDFSKTQSYKKQLEFANFKTQSLLKSREQLISTVSHDLKTPLSTIIGYTELLGNSLLTNKQTYFTNNIKNSSEYISRLVQDLLDFSQIEAGKIALKTIPFSLDTIIHEVANNIKAVHSQKNINLTISIHELLKQTSIGDPFRLKQVLINIVGNAYKFTNEGFITINATPSSNKKFVFITIQDSGIGIEKDSQELVFEEFAQANETIEKNYGGTGLGLAISKKITLLLGGELYLKNSSENGSCFEIKLPLLFDKQPSVTQNNPLIGKLNEQHRTIVIVDDDLDLLALSTEVLKQHFKVVPFSNSENALQFLLSNSFDLLITDIQMPIMDGFELLIALQKNKKINFTNLSLVAVTGRSDLKEEVYQNAGFTAIIKKPFTPAILLQTIASILNNTPIILSDKEVFKEPTTKLFSLNSLSLFLSNDKEAIKTVIKSFISSTHSNLFILENNITNFEQEKVKQMAHKMAPMFKQIQAIEVATLLDQLELNEYSELELKQLLSDLKLKVRILLLELEKQFN